MSEPNIVQRKPLGMQLCVPDNWTDEQIVAFAEKENPCGTEHGWQLRQEGDAMLLGTPARVLCEKYFDNVHVVVDA